MKAEHTKGPWVIQPNNGPHAIYAPKDGTDHPFVCQVYFDNRADEETKQKQKANAALISAAPDLLEALEGLIYGTRATITFKNEEARNLYSDAIERGKAAIQKAKKS